MMLSVLCVIHMAFIQTERRVGILMNFLNHVYVSTNSVYGSLPEDENKLMQSPAGSNSRKRRNHSLYK